MESEKGNKVKTEEDLQVKCEFQSAIPAMIRSGKEKRHLLEMAQQHLYFLERYLDDNIMHRRVNHFLMTSASVDALMALCRQEYGSNIIFGEDLRSNTVETPMGPAYFKISEIGMI